MPELLVAAHLARQRRAADVKSSWQQLMGAVSVDRPLPARRTEDAARMWTVSQELVGVSLG